jgi:hypothetical protein
MNSLKSWSNSLVTEMNIQMTELSRFLTTHVSSRMPSTSTTPSSMKALNRTSGSKYIGRTSMIVSIHLSEIIGTHLRSPRCGAAHAIPLPLG